MDEGILNKKLKSNNQPTDDEGLMSVISANPSKLFEIYKDENPEIKKENNFICNIKDEFSPTFKKSFVSIYSNNGFLAGFSKTELEDLNKKKKKKKKKVKFAMKNNVIIQIESFKEYNKNCCYHPQAYIEIRRPSCLQECSIFFSKCLIY